MAYSGSDWVDVAQAAEVDGAPIGGRLELRPLMWPCKGKRYALPLHEFQRLGGIESTLQHQGSPRRKGRAQSVAEIARPYEPVRRPAAYILAKPEHAPPPPALNGDPTMRAQDALWTIGGAGGKKQSGCIRGRDRGGRRIQQRHRN